MEVQRRRQLYGEFKRYYHHNYGFNRLDKYLVTAGGCGIRLQLDFNHCVSVFVTLDVDALFQQLDSICLVHFIVTYRHRTVQHNTSMAGVR